MNENKIIILNKMYSGNYLKEENLGHEIINLYKSDNGNNYIYLLSSGKLDKKYSGRVSCVLLVRQLKENLVEIIGKATGLEEVYGKVENQMTYIEENDIKYAGVSLRDIFQGDDYQDVCITFKADKVVKPKKSIYVQYERGVSEYYPRLIGVNRGQSSHQFIFEENEDAYKTLSGIIDNNDLWGDEVECVSTTDTDDLTPHTIFDICRITHNELVHTNALGYFLKNDKAFADRFLKEVLGIDEVLSDDYKVYRELYHIDLLIIDKGRAIIIENKIKSDINGVYIDTQKREKDSQLDRYIQVAQPKEGNPPKEFSGVERIYAYLLSPEYNDIKDIERYNQCDVKYKKITYGQLYKLMRTDILYISGSDFQIFTDAIKRHTLNYDSNLYDEMRYRFLDRLNALKS